MSIKLSRRSVVKSLATATAVGAINPLGLLRNNSAHASIPMGDYLSNRDSSRFWFRRLKSDLSSVADPATLKPIDGVDGQLSLRIGGAGGFAIGFFSTINFLSSYKTSRPDDYLDLIVNSARVPESPNRAASILRILEVHRKTAGRTISAPTSTLRDGSVTDFITENPQPTELAGTEFSDGLVSPLESMSRKSIPGIFRNLLSESRVSRLSMTTADVMNVIEPESWEDAQRLVKQELDGEFEAFSTGFDDRPEAMDISRLLQYEDGKLKLEWVDDVLLALEFQTGVEHGRLAALANSAFHDTAELTKVESDLISPVGTGSVTPEHLDRVTKKLTKLKAADEISRCFGEDDFWKFAFDSAPFRPAVRLKVICALNTEDVGARVVELMTPFLPYDATRSLGRSDLERARKIDHEISSSIVDSFGDPSLSRYSLPEVTSMLPQAAFTPCAEMMRHTVRLFESVNQKNSEIFSKTSIGGVSIVPEITSPWTFSGVSAAFCNTYLMALDENKLNTEESRAKYRRNVGMSVDSLLKNSVGRGQPGSRSNPDVIANSSAVTPAFVQYASGYRAATLFSDRVTDQIAQAEGARKVYRNLQIAMPEFFQDLADDKFLTADVIAGQVLLVARSVQSEVVRLRDEVKRLQLRVQELETTVAGYQKFIAEFTREITSLQTQLAAVRTQEDLTKFQENNQDLMKRMTSAFDDSQKSMVGSMQGLVNTFVVVSNNIAIDIRVEMQAKIDAAVLEKSKIQVNMCSVGNQK